MRADAWPEWVIWLAVALIWLSWVLLVAAVLSPIVLTVRYIARALAARRKPSFAPEDKCRCGALFLPSDTSSFPAWDRVHSRVFCPPQQEMIP